MSAPSPFPSSQPQQPFPALHLYPVNDSFVPKRITLLSNQHVKIGRRTGAKTAPSERNGYFNSKALSRHHAEVWEEGGKIFIQDFKSSNGTFINGERLSPDGFVSEPFKLENLDIVKFGVDIFGEDAKTIIHHKVVARVMCVFNEHDVRIAGQVERIQQARLLQQQQQQQQEQLQEQQYHPPPNGTIFLFSFFFFLFSPIIPLRIYCMARCSST